jgi:hypothetical protein
MLALDDPRWSTLRHAYGAAGDVPRWLDALPDEDVWESLWSALCHQGSVYTASYAAVPHLAAIAGALPPVPQARYWKLIAAIAGARDAAPIPDDLRDAYEVALEIARARILVCLTPDADASWLLVAIAQLRGWRAVADAVESLCDGEIYRRCARCRRELFVDVSVAPFAGAVIEPRSPRTELRALADLARETRQPTLADRVVALDADAICPGCGHRVSLLTP